MDPNHSTVINRTLVDINGEENSKKLPCNRKWCNLVWKPVDEEDLQLQGVFPNLQSTSFPMGFMFTSPVADAFEFECYDVLELVGKNMRGKTLSQSDPSGFNAVHSATQTAHQSVHQNDNPNAATGSIIKAAHSHLAQQSEGGLGSSLLRGAGSFAAGFLDDPDLLSGIATGALSFLGL